MTYFNEIDAFAAEWCGNIHGGHVDQRSIRDVRAADLAGFRRCHFFAGIGCWEYALQLAGWPEDREVWTGSCPCQPFSVAGKRKGTADERHLWPEFFRLISECRPSMVIGEQVSGPAGRAWLAGVRSDLERIGYVVGAADLPAACVGSPHIRQRMFWVAQLSKSSSTERGRRTERQRERRAPIHAPDCGGAGAVRDSASDDERRERERGEEHGRNGETGGPSAGSIGNVPHATLNGDGPQSVGGMPGNGTWRRRQVSGGSGVDGVRDSISAGRQERIGDGGIQREAVGASARQAAVGTSGPWDDWEPLRFLDGKTRRIESGLECLVDGAAFRLADGRSRADTSRAQILRCIGNAIVPAVAAEFIMSFLECEQ